MQISNLNSAVSRSQSLGYVARPMRSDDDKHKSHKAHSDHNPPKGIVQRPNNTFASTASHDGDTHRKMFAMKLALQNN